jgi:hypothetical protein
MPDKKNRSGKKWRSCDKSLRNFRNIVLEHSKDEARSSQGREEVGKVARTQQEARKWYMRKSVSTVQGWGRRVEISTRIQIRPKKAGTDTAGSKKKWHTGANQQT